MPEIENLPKKGTTMQGLFHGFVALLLFLLFGIVPGSFCPAALLTLLLLAFGIGRRSSAVETDDDAPQSPLPWVMLMYGAAMFLGAVLNLGFLVFVARGK